MINSDLRATASTPQPNDIVTEDSAATEFMELYAGGLRYCHHTGATLTEYALRSGRLEILPPCWMLAYGSSLMGLGLFAGRAFRVAALAFLVFGALSLFLLRSHGLIMMLVSFGGLHLLLGAWVLWKRRA